MGDAVVLEASGGAQEGILVAAVGKHVVVMLRVSITWGACKRLPTGIYSRGGLTTRLQAMTVHRAEEPHGSHILFVYGKRPVCRAQA